ncbi:hypothetical protein CBL_10710 [Carabus blaptoides fortunei]
MVHFRVHVSPINFRQDGVTKLGEWIFLYGTADPEEVEPTTISMQPAVLCAENRRKLMLKRGRCATKLAKLFMVILYEESYSTLRIHSHVTKAVRPPEFTVMAEEENEAGNCEGNRPS